MTDIPIAPPVPAAFTFVHHETKEVLKISGIVWQTKDRGVHFQLDQHVPPWCMSGTQAEISINVSIE